MKLEGRRILALILLSVCK